MAFTLLPATQKVPHDSSPRAPPHPVTVGQLAQCSFLRHNDRGGPGRKGRHEPRASRERACTGHSLDGGTQHHSLTGPHRAEGSDFTHQPQTGLNHTSGIPKANMERPLGADSAGTGKLASPFAGTSPGVPVTWP